MSVYSERKRDVSSVYSERRRHVLSVYGERKRDVLSVYSKMRIAFTDWQREFHCRKKGGPSFMI